MSQMTTLHLMVAWNDSLRQNDDAQMTQSSFLVHRLPLTAHLFMHWVPGSTKQFHLLTDCGYGGADDDITDDAIISKIE